MNDDLISREWLKDAFDNLCCHNCKTCRNFRNEDSFYKCNLIDNAPTVERPEGEWIEHYSKELSDKGFYLCSRCKAGFQRYERGVRHSDLPWIDGQKYELHCIDNFCPNCGAKMKEAENE